MMKMYDEDERKKKNLALKTFSSSIDDKTKEREDRKNDHAQKKILSIYE